MVGINVWAILVSAIVAFNFGGLWYSKKMFGKIWSKENGNPCSDSKMKKGHARKVMITSFFLMLIAAVAFAMILGPYPNLTRAVVLGFLVGFCFVATSFGVNYLFSNRSYKIILIDGGFHTLQFVIYGIILGLWH
jgi:hypothetical protein